MSEPPNKALRRARLKAGLLQGDVARSLGISPGYLADIEFGRRQFPEDRLPDLPEPIRSVVRESIIATYQRRIDRLREVA